jgi:hypothetical protein
MTGGIVGTCSVTVTEKGEANPCMENRGNVNLSEAIFRFDIRPTEVSPRALAHSLRTLSILVDTWRIGFEGRDA